MNISSGTRLVASRTPDLTHLGSNPENPLLTLCDRTLEAVSLNSFKQSTDSKHPFETIATSKHLTEDTRLPNIVLLPGTVDFKPPSPLTPLCVLLTACRLVTLPPPDNLDCVTRHLYVSVHNMQQRLAALFLPPSQPLHTQTLQQPLSSFAFVLAMPQAPSEGGHRRDLSLPHSSRRDRDRGGDDYDRGGGGDRDRGGDHTSSRRGLSDFGRRYTPHSTRGSTVDGRKDPRYEQLNYKWAGSYCVFKDVMQLWDIPLFMIATIRLDQRADPNDPTHYFCDPDGYTDQRSAVLALPSAIIPKYDEQGQRYTDILRQGQRVVIRIGIQAIGGKLQVEFLLQTFPIRDSNGHCTIQEDPTKPIPSMDICIHQGHYIHANTPEKRTLIGVIQEAGGDRSPEIMERVNQFLEDTRPQQRDMFGVHLPQMRIGGPLHIRQHPSWI